MSQSQRRILKIAAIAVYIALSGIYLWNRFEKNRRLKQQENKQEQKEKKSIKD